MPPRQKKSTSNSGGTGVHGGASGASGIGDSALQWARAVPATLVGARFDAQAIGDGLAELAQALRLRASLETDRSIAASCVEPYEEAAQKVLAAVEDCQEVHQRLLARYQATAEDLARPDTPEPEYLKEGV